MTPFDRDDFITFAIDSKLTNFNELAALLYQHQRTNNSVFQKFIIKTNGADSDVFRFLPVSFFKTEPVCCGNFTPEKIFTSSSTSGNIPSKHFVRDNSYYIRSYHETFRLFYGKPEEYVFLCLLPSYLERDGSSLIEMARGLINKSGNPYSGFYLNDFDRLKETILKISGGEKKIFLLGVTFALLDFAEQNELNLGNTIVMETGGMKGRKEEKTREEIHAYLKNKFNVKNIHSEYGMTEMLSQAYAVNNGLFQCPPWLKIVITDINDPFQQMPAGKAGIINIIDLANIDSCAFIQTDDIGRLHNDGSFEVLGRMDHSEVRGCNLMYT